MFFCLFFKKIKHVITHSVNLTHITESNRPHKALMLMCARVRKRKRSTVLVIARYDMIRADKHRESTLKTNKQSARYSNT